MNSAEFKFEKLNDICKVEVLVHLASASVSGKLKEIIDEMINKHKCRKILFDLTKVEFVDSSFLGAIVYAYKNLLNYKGKITCVISVFGVYDRFVISQLDRLFKIFSNLEDGIKYLQS